MSAANTDKFIKLAPKWTGTIGSAGVSDDSTTTIPLSSTTNLPTDTPVIATIDRVDANSSSTPSKMEGVLGIVSGDNLVSCVRGVEGTAQAHSAGAVVEILVTAYGWNRMVDGILAEHDQSGEHTKTLSNDLTIADDKDIKFASGAKIERDGGDIVVTPESGKAFKVGANLAMLFSHTRFKIGSFTRDVSAAAGDVSETGIGFTPAAIIFIGTVNTTTKAFWGFDNETARGCIYYRASDYSYDTPSYSLVYDDGSGNTHKGKIKSFDADGFTITWAKVGSPTGTLQIFYLALR